MWKRYQIYTKDGITWSNWFHLTGDFEKEQWQIKNKLKNEYMSDEEYSKTI